MKEKEKNKNKCITCTNYNKEKKCCNDESHTCIDFNFSTCTDYLIDKKLIMF